MNWLVDVRGYESLQQRVSILEGIARGERAIKGGRVVSHAGAKKRKARLPKACPRQPVMAKCSQPAQSGSRKVRLSSASGRK